MNETEMNKLIEDWNRKHPDCIAAPPELLLENEKQEMVWCEQAKEWFPMYTMEKRSIGEIVYKLNPEQNFTYNAAFTDVTEEEEEIGYYGRKWQEFMETNYPDTVLEMSIGSLDWDTVSRRVNEEAEELYRKLDEQYRRANPRPTEDFMEIARWEKMKQLEIDHEVMTTVVLQYREE